MQAKKWTSEDASKVKNVSTPTGSKKIDEQVSIFDVPVSSDHQNAEGEECLVQIRLLDGSTVKAQFNKNDSLEMICEYLANKELGIEYKEGISLTVNNFPKRTKYEGDSIRCTSLAQAGLAPNGNVIVERSVDKGFKPKEKKLDIAMYQTVVSVNPFKLKGESYESIEAFQKRQADKEYKEKEMERRKKREQLVKVRAQLSEREKDRSINRMITPPVQQQQQQQHISEKKQVSEVQVQVQLHDGSKLTLTMLPNQTLEDLHLQLMKRGKLSAQEHFSFIEPPRREFKFDSWKHTSFSSAGLIPRCALKIVLASQKGNVIKGVGAPQNMEPQSPLPNPVMPFGSNDGEDY